MSRTVEGTTLSRALRALLWVARVLLALAFGASGLMKLTRPLAGLGAEMAWVQDVPGLLVRFIGFAEVAGAIGVVLPAATGIRPGLTPLAAMGLLLIMVLAMGFHLVRGEFDALPINMALGGLAAFVVWARR